MGPCPPSLPSTTSLVVISLFLHAIVAILPTDPSSQLVGDYFAQSPDEQPDPDGHHVREPRLLELLQLRKLIHSMVKDSQVENNGASWEGVASAETLPGAPSKRVFCNHYTGCGGRFRGRRRMVQQKAVGKRTTSKKPFCNHYGCGNGRKRLAPPASSPNFPTSDPHSHAKRLFCNIYGGCQNFGKRDEVSQLDSDMASVEDQEDVPRLTLKRFLNGGYDRNMQALLAKLRR